MNEDVTNGELARSLTRIEGKLDKVSDDHENRLRRIERVTHIALGLGVAGATSGVGSMLSTFIGG